MTSPPIVVPATSPGFVATIVAVSAAAIGKRTHDLRSTRNTSTRSTAVETMPTTFPDTRYSPVSLAAPALMTMGRGIQRVPPYRSPSYSGGYRTPSSAY
jgi:hypothetical protein